MLISYGGSLDHVNKNGLSPVHIAALGDNAYPLAFLYENGLNMDAIDNNG